jgi:alpha-1,2-mannosyltransferase
MGRFADIVMVNSSWTYGHIHGLWPTKKISGKRTNNGENIDIVYPPVAVSYFNKIPSNPEGREPIILSIGQFRPEKDHKLQLEAFAKLLDKYQDQVPQKLKLVLLGGVRDEGDRQRVSDLEKLANELGIQDRVEFMKGVPFSQLVEVSSRALIGLHTMWNEHFGICVVEYMASGLIPLAHKSGGPKMDIVDEGVNGYLADDAQEYANKMYEILEMDLEKRKQMQEKTRQKAAKFSDEKFEDAVRESLQYVL